jgi:hypothetical protein
MHDDRSPRRPTCEPIDSTRFGERYDDTAAARALRDEVRRAMLVGIEFPRDQREEDPNRGLLARLRHRAE